MGFDEICYVFEGTVHTLVEDEVFVVKKGDWHLRPRGKVHTFWNSGPEHAKVIEMYTPAGHEAYMKDLTKLFENGQNPNPGALQQLSQTYDIKFHFDKLDEITTKYKVRL